MNVKKLYTFLLAIFLLMLIIYSTLFINETIPATSLGSSISSAKAMTVLEAKSGRVLLEKNQENNLPMASTTKIMTALVVLENCNNLDEIVNIDKRAIGIEGTSIYLTDKENLSVRELLYGLMLASANDASVALASFVGDGNIDKFVSMMNDKAKEIGALNTHFVNPHGLDADGHYTTSYDLALITSKALENPIFREIVSTKNKTISGNEKVEARYLKNKQRLLNTYENCIGVKSGFTDNAGRCLVTAVEDEDMLVICVVLNCGDMFEETARLLDEVFEKYKMEEVLSSYKIMTQVSVNGGTKEKVNVISKKEFNYPLTEIEKSFIIIENDLPSSLDAPINTTDSIGTITVKLNDEIIYESELYSMDEVEKEYIKTELDEIIENWSSQI